MASEISSSYAKKKNRPGFMTLLSSALCEWFLIALLFLEAALSYILTQFARYCDLKTPCPLCSRIEALSSGNKKLGCFYSLLCLDHKEQVSSITCCSVHNKLADVSNMCEECLSPLAIQKNSSNPGSYRLSLGKLWVDIDKSLLQNLIASKRIQLSSLGRGTCSCCNKTWRAKSNADRLMLDLKAVGLGASKANVKPPLPRVPGRSRFSRRDSLKRLRDKITGSPLDLYTDGTKSVDTLSHVGYTKLKLGSDTESEFPFSEDDDDDDGRNITSSAGKRSYVRSDDEVQYGRESAGKLQKLFVFDQPDLLLDLGENDGSRDLGLENSSQKKEKVITEELITIDDISQAPHVPQSSAFSALNELLSLQTDISSSDIAVIGKKYIEVEPAMDVSSENAEEVESSSNNNDNLSDDSIENKETRDLPNEKEVEQISAVESAKMDEDLESSSDESQSVDPQALSRNNEEVKPQTISTLASPKGKNEEGEKSFEHLQKQVEHYQSCMNSLYKELEEERNAAAIAANEAMAMITRLQEEKAALHMEALQYLRMMEEQAQYDSEALERANDLLTDREKELQDLEAELEFYRNNLADESGEIGTEDLILDSRTKNGEDSHVRNGLEDDIEAEVNHESNVNHDEENDPSFNQSDEILENHDNANSNAESKKVTTELQERVEKERVL